MSKTKQTRKQHGDEFKAEALTLARQVGVAHRGSAPHVSDTVRAVGGHRLFNRWRQSALVGGAGNRRRTGWADQSY